MLIYCDLDKVLFVIGNGVVARQTASLLSQEHDHTQLIDPDQAVDLPDKSQCVMGFMNHNYRTNLLTATAGKNFSWPSYVHPTAHVADHCSLGKGVVVLDHAHVGFECVIADWCYLDSKVTVCHGSRLGQNCVLTIGTVVGGSTIIGNHVVTGLNTTFRNKIKVCDNVRFAMNSSITRDIVDPGDYYGNKKIAKVEI